MSLQLLHHVCRITLKQKQLKTGRFRRITESALGAGGRAFKSPRPDQWKQLRYLQWPVEPWRSGELKFLFRLSLSHRT